MNAIVFFLYILLTFIIAVLLLPLLLPVSLIFRIYRHTLMWIISGKIPDAVFASSSDSIWFQDSTKNPAVIHSIIEFHGKLDLGLFKKRLEECMLGKKTKDGKPLLFKAKYFGEQYLHRYLWIEDQNFNIENHVFIHPGTVPKTNEDLKRIASEICATPFPPKSPLWQFVIIPGPTNHEDCFHAIFRVHHSVADGTSLIKMLLQIIVDKPPEDMLILKKFGTKWSILKALGALVSAPGLLLQQLFFQKDQHILHGEILSGNKLFAWSESVKLDLIKKIKNSTNTTVNDVLMSCLAGAFDEYFKQNSQSRPENFQAYVPVDIRPPSDEIVMDNQFSLLILCLPVVANDRLSRLRETKNRMDQLKKSPLPIINSLFMRYCIARIPNWLTKWMFDWFSDKCTMVLSNLPGPQEKVSICGYTVNGMTFFPPQRSNVGLGISILSYAGYVRAGIMVDKAITTKPDILMRLFNEEINNLADELKLN